MESCGKTKTGTGSGFRCSTSTVEKIKNRPKQAAKLLILIDKAGKKEYNKSI